MIMARTIALLALPAVALAKLNDCAAIPGFSTGIDPSTISGTVLNPVTPMTLKLECDTMYPFLKYSGSGIPCGSSVTPACIPGPNISFPNAMYPLAALDALADEVQATLNRGVDNTDAGSELDTTEFELVIEEPTQMNMTFLSEGACDRNSIGMTRFLQTSVTNGDARDMTFMDRQNLLKNDLDFSIIFPNVDFEFCVCAHEDTPDRYDDFCTETSPVLTRGTTMRLIEDFRQDPNDLTFDAGYFVSFFLLDDGFDNGFREGMLWDDRAESVLFTTKELNDPDMIRKTPDFEDLRQHAFVFMGFESIEAEGETFDFSKEIFVCFEDRRRFIDGEGTRTDNDFEDLCVFITADPPITGFAPSAAPSEAPSGVPSAQPSFAICDVGILSECGNVCCADSCGTCGGCDCASKDGGADLCCPQAILFAGVECMSATDVGCIVDNTLVCSAPGSGCDRF